LYIKDSQGKKILPVILIYKEKKKETDCFSSCRVLAVTAYASKKVSGGNLMSSLAQGLWRISVTNSIMSFKENFDNMAFTFINGKSTQMPISSEKYCKLPDKISIPIDQVAQTNVKYE
jgi:hypothetical protein